MSQIPDPPDSFTSRSYVDANMDDALGRLRIATFARHLRALWRMLDDAEPWEVAVILFALGYFLWPIDVIPDSIPVLGWTDDAAVVAAAIATLGHRVARYLG